jgi:hypothetical protein
MHSIKKAKGQIKAREQSRKGGVKDAEVQLQVDEPL